MKVGRRIWLAAAVTLGLSGCRAAGTGSLSMSPRPLPLQRSFDVEAFVAEHNRNAERIQSLTARPSIELMGRLVGRGKVDGHLAMERPRNFKLQLSTAKSDVADIGSNDQEFWFWVQNPNDKSIYWCNHSELETSGVALPFQPDWIIDALGLKSIPSEEVARIQVQNGRTPPGTSTLIFPPFQAGGESYNRVLVVTNRDRRIKEHRILAADGKTVLLQADLSDYKEYVLPDAGGRDGDRCFLAEKIKLDWSREQLALDVAMKEVKINQFDSSRAAALFVEPDLEGYSRKNIADLGPPPSREKRGSMRQSMPSPEPRNGVKLGEPAPLGDDEAIVPRVGRASLTPQRRPVAPLFEEVVGAAQPAPPSSDVIQAAGTLGSNPAAYSVER